MKMRLVHFRMLTIMRCVIFLCMAETCFSGLGMCIIVIVLRIEIMKLSDPSLLKTDAFINGEFVSAPQDKRFAVTNPSTGETVAQVADFGTDGITAAIAAAGPQSRLKPMNLARSIIVTAWSRS